MMAAVMVGVAAACSASSAGSAGSSRRLQRSLRRREFRQARGERRTRQRCSRHVAGPLVQMKDHVESRASCVRVGDELTVLLADALPIVPVHFPIPGRLHDRCSASQISTSHRSPRARDAERAVDSIPAATVQSVTSRFRRVACGARHDVVEGRVHGIERIPSRRVGRFDLVKGCEE